MGDLWDSSVVVTTSRGLGNTLAMAEYAVAGILHFAKGLHRAPLDRTAGAFDHRAYRPILLEGKTACVVGVGGKFAKTFGRFITGPNTTPLCSKR
jgi:phosphoglycerate dehydrogenase-like enzyme